MNLNGLKYIVVGSGFWGAVIAERISSILNEKVLVIEKRNHAGGNCYSEIDKATGIEYHKYGTHIFHTKSRTIWQYITQFGDFLCYQHRVFTSHNGTIYSMPINLGTINAFFKKNLNPTEAISFIEMQSDKSQGADSLETKAISMIGKPLYDAFIRGYTRKQWGVDPTCYPRTLSLAYRFASIIIAITSQIPIKVSLPMGMELYFVECSCTRI